MTRIAVIGAGISGLVVARALSRRHQVTVFEKSRGVGGRIATRYAEPWEFDHGAQFFTARSGAFRRFLAPLVEAGVIQSWNATFAELDRSRVRATRGWDDTYPHYVAVPRMNSLGKHLAAGLEVSTRTTIERLDRRDAGWQLTDGGGGNHGLFDWVICTAPGPQTAALLPDDSPLSPHASRVDIKGCFALMLGFDRPLELPWQAALVRGADVSWISANSSKPGRGDAPALLAHSTNAWADAHIDDDIDAVREHLQAEVSAVLARDVSDAAHAAVHRWRYANLDRLAELAPQIDADQRLAACGDWFVRGRVEAAFTSAKRLVADLDQAI